MVPPFLLYFNLLKFGSIGHPRLASSSAATSTKLHVSLARAPSTCTKTLSTFERNASCSASIDKEMVVSKTLLKKLWTHCDNCGEILYIKDLKKNFNVCSSCGAHLQVGWVVLYWLIKNNAKLLLLLRILVGKWVYFGYLVTSGELQVARASWIYGIAFMC